MRELCKKVLETLLNSNVEPIWLDCRKTITKVITKIHQKKVL